MTDSSGHDVDSAQAILRWPPPGLERMQGDLGSIAARAALAGGLLVLPMLFVIAREQSFATLGPLADAWWVTVLLASVGLGFAIDALVRTARMLRRAGRALGAGYDLATVVHVLIDRDRDMGFLLQGARHFIVMDARERSAIARIRVFAAVLLALAGLWLSVFLGVGLLAAARGSLSPSGLWMATLLPAVAAYVFGGVGRIVQDARVRRARKAFHKQPWAEDLTSEEIESWHRERATRRLGDGAVPRPTTALAPALQRVGLVVGLLGLVVALPIITLMPTAIVGPVLTMIATPGFDQARHRAAEVEGLRAHVVAVDPAITPQEAGRLLHDISYVGTDREPPPGEREPSRRVVQPWLPDMGESDPLGLLPYAWGDSLIEFVARGTTGAQRAYLAQVASHPVSADFSRLARAGALDAASARWVSPFPVGTTIATMPVPRFGELRAAAQAHIGAAAYALVQGRAARADTLLSEVISVGLLLGDDGPTLIDNFVGFALADAGGDALEDLYVATGDIRALEELTRLRAAARRAANRVHTPEGRGTEGWVRSMPELVLDSAAVRGLRWEYFIGVTTLTPCLNLHRIVFGPDDEYAAFLEAAHDSLVRWPSEEGLFEIASGGWLGTIQSERATLMGRLLSISMRRGSGACGEILRKVEAAEALF
jgi:hypothetical protein